MKSRLTSTRFTRIRSATARSIGFVLVAGFLVLAPQPAAQAAMTQCHVA
jgi:hypothetical protein